MQVSQQVLAFRLPHVAPLELCGARGSSLPLWQPLIKNLTYCYFTAYNDQSSVKLLIRSLGCIARDTFARNAYICDGRGNGRTTST